MLRADQYCTDVTLTPQFSYELLNYSPTQRMLTKITTLALKLRVGVYTLYFKAMKFLQARNS